MLIKYAYRNLKKRPILNGIKIVGLALGLCGILFIALFIKNELGYDQHHTRADQIFRLTVTTPNVFEDNHFARFYASEELPFLTDPLPEVKGFLRLAPVRGNLVQYQEQFYGISQGFVVDETFFDLFDIKLLKGNTNTVFQNPESVVVSKTLANKVFKNENPIGQIISLPKGHFNENRTDFEVTGIMENPVQQSHIHPDILFMPGKDKIRGWAYQYLLLDENANTAALAAKFSAALSELFTLDGAEEKVNVTAHLMNIKDIHLKSDLFREIEPNGSMSNIWVLVLAGVILILIAISNFASLNLGMAGYLSTFLALNQILGAERRIMVKYFSIESGIIILLAIGLVVLGMFQFNALILENYQLNLLQGNGWFAVLTIFATALLMLMAGLQPIIKNRFEHLSLNQTLQKAGKVKGHNILLVTQFTLATVLLIGVVVISKQTSFALDKGLGAQENIICLPSVHSEVQKDFTLFKNKLLKQADITSVSAMMDRPGSETHDMFAYNIEGVPEPEPGSNLIGVFAADYSFADVFGLQFLSGKNFSEEATDEDGNGEYLINESALKHLGFQDADAIVDKGFGIISPVPEVTLPKGKIIGVVKDFHLSGLQNKVEPLVLFKRADSWLNSVVISYNATSKKEVTQKIETIWDSMFPAYPLDYVAVDAIYQNVYKTEILQKRLILLFALISIFVCTMGVLGLALMVAQSRYKEIGIRKVNGASKSEILALLNRDFVKWLLVSFILAMPLSYFAVTSWLQGFAYKISLNPWLFLFSGGAVVLITLLTVSWQSYKAANQNPVKSLRVQ
ncbi:Putative ABC transporter, permease protein [Croceitalea dokdonensis DOKDO 023]|uniref:Putative ABC transporter, permease protein n=1 Tax=Croceitalea dokdonensis DOKDO 023 TaxID=1300341 RepID=A0A0N8H3K6_9FLAO|nr:ABC transporter permease [Croceitalea dokdonensis]KPM30836.1 Putative ABC transporter, permease protein [Croceitalea dokdonensis DOKDO 023]